MRKDIGVGTDDREGEGISRREIQRWVRKLNLQAAADRWSRQYAIKAFKDGDAGGFTTAAYDTDGTLQIVADNWFLLKRRGIYEAAVVHGYTGCRNSHRLSDMDDIQRMFDFGDREKLRTVGSPLPGPGPYTVYRGVGREGSERQVDGMSWTTSLDIACWFAWRGLYDPAVYQATVSGDEVYCYFRDRNEEELICRPKESQRLQLTWKELETRAVRVATDRRHEEADKPGRFQCESV